MKPTACHFDNSLLVEELHFLGLLDSVGMPVPTLALVIGERAATPGI